VGGVRRGGLEKALSSSNRKKKSNGPASVAGKPVKLKSAQKGIIVLLRKRILGNRWESEKKRWGKNAYSFLTIKGENATEEGNSSRGVRGTGEEGHESAETAL